MRKWYDVKKQCDVDWLPCSDITHTHTHTHAPCSVMNACSTTKHQLNNTSSQPCHCLQCFEQQGHLNILADKNTCKPHLIFANIHVHIGPCLNTGQPKWTDYLGFPSQQLMEYLLLLGLATPNIHMFNVHYPKNGKHNMIKSWWMTFLSIWVGQVYQMQRVIEQCLTNIKKNYERT